MSDANNDSQLNELSVEDWFDGDLEESGNSSLSSRRGSGLESPKLAEQLRIHSLLIGQFDSPTSREQRIQSAMDAFDRQCVTPNDPKTSRSNAGKPSLGGRKRWLLFATTAATILLGLGVWGLLGPQNAQAALNRVLAATRLPVTRVYEAKIYRQVLGREVQRDAVLYSQSVNLFAAEFQEKRGRQKAWIGFDGHQRWLTTEKHQWRSTDTNDLWSDELFDRMTSKNMHYNAMLTELPDSFDVRLLPAETISIGGISINCRPIEATPHKPSPNFPNVIRIWPHPQSGVILQMHMIIDDGSPLSVRRIELQFLREQEVPEDFFTIDYHHPM